ncbi:MAG: acyl-CoA dehydrogenase [Bdellovibrionales bacterium]
MPFPYTPPLSEIRFVLTRLIGTEKLSSLPGYEAVGEDIIDAILDGAGKIASEVFAPLNDTGDKVGIKFLNDTIVMPEGFKEAYRAYIDGGWNGLQVEEKFGGQGLPSLLGTAVFEMLQAANVSLSLCPMLNVGAIELLSMHGDESTKKKYLPKMVSGEWSGAMDMTESQAGSDVGAVKTKAVAEGDHYLITGQKIFISYGDHDMAENIIHLVLARLPNAPDGTRGLSLFLVPKILVNNDGTLGNKNEVRVVSIEHKMGMHSSPTCVMSYGDYKGSVGYLIGKENGGIAAMFTMMNNARLNVGIQGLGVMERSYQHARDYAKTRVQSRPIDNPKAASTTIIHHPDVRRMLMIMKVLTEAARAIAYQCALAIDVSKHSQDATQKSEASARGALLTPIAKAWITDRTNEVASMGIQVLGGAGYIEEAGAAQHMRDARVLAIYEGTNGIQAQDLVFRKLVYDQGTAFYSMTTEIKSFLNNWPKDMPKDFGVIFENLSLALTAAVNSGAWILKNGKTNPAMTAASAEPFLQLFGNILGGYYLARSALLAQVDLTTKKGHPEYLVSKIISAKFYATHFLPHCQALSATIYTGADATMSTTEASFI